MRFFIIFALWLLAFPAVAQMNAAQIAVLRTAILADASIASLVAARRDDLIADYYNQASDPAFVLWKTSLPVDEVMRNGMDWARVDNLSVGKARIWEWMSRLGTLNCAAANVRAGIDATWVGTAADLAVRAAVYTHCKRVATRAERLFASGTGSDAVPGTTTWQGSVSTNDVSTALN